MTEQYAGVWSMARSVIDHEQETELTCTGSARLRVCDGVVLYDEAVSFRLAGKLMHATRDYRFVSSNRAIVAMFSDGSPFFSLRLGVDGIGTAVHLCRDDVYALTLTLREPAAWQTQWNISGSKRMKILTRYSR